MKIKRKAPAKINLTLEIIKKMPNGYHQLRSAVLKLDLADEIFISIDRKKRGINISCDVPEVPCDQRNTCSKAVKLYFDKTGKEAGIDISIKKNIPAGGGLGGGSSDAAQVLLALDEFFGKILSGEEILHLGAEIGKDVPLFLFLEKTIIMSGMGERIKVLPSAPNFYYLIINPRLEINTKKAYGLLSPKIESLGAKRKNMTKRMENAILKRSQQDIIGNLYNDFERVIEKKYPVISEIKKSLIECGAMGALMTGSGSTVFGLFPSKKELETGRMKMMKRYPEFIIR